MQQGSSAKAGAAPASKKAPALSSKAAAVAPKKAAAAAPRVNKKAAAAAPRVNKAAAPSAGANKPQCTPNATGAASVAGADIAAAPIPSDREGRARIVYNHYNSFFPVDSSGRLRWRAVDDEYCLSFGATQRTQRVSLAPHACAQCSASSACRDSHLRRCFLTAMQLQLSRGRRRIPPPR